MKTITCVMAPQEVSSGDIWDKINSMQDVYALSGLDPTKPVFKIEVQEVLAEEAECVAELFNATLLCKLINGNGDDGKPWKPDYADSKQYKWGFWLKYVPGSGFAFYGSDFAYDFAFLGARPAFKRESDAKKCYEKFPEMCHKLCSYYSKQFTQYQ